MISESTRALQVSVQPTQAEFLCVLMLALNQISIRGYHPWGYLNDETSLQPEAGECYNEVLSAVKGKIILNSSAGPGWYADTRRDIIRNNED